MADPQPGTMENAMARLLTPIEPAAAELDKPAVVEDIPEEVVPDETQEEIPDDVPPVAEGEDATVKDPEGVTEPETVTITAEEHQRLLDGNLKNEDYSQKTMALAEQRRVDEESRVTLSKDIELATLVSQLEQEDLASKENLELKEYDPQAYYDKRDKAQERQTRLDKLIANQGTVFAEQAQGRLAQEQELLLPAIPEWTNRDTMLKEVQLCKELWQRMGMDAVELKGMTSHRWIVLSRKAALYDRIQAAKPEVKQVTPKPKTAKPGAASTKTERSSKQQDVAKKKLRETGKPADAVKVLLG